MQEQDPKTLQEFLRRHADVLDELDPLRLRVFALQAEEKRLRHWIQVELTKFDPALKPFAMPVIFPEQRVEHATVTITDKALLAKHTTELEARIQSSIRWRKSHEHVKSETPQEIEAVAQAPQPVGIRRRCVALGVGRGGNRA